MTLTGYFVIDLVVPTDQLLSPETTITQEELRQRGIILDMSARGLVVRSHQSDLQDIRVTKVRR